MWTHGRHAGFAESIWVLDRFARLDIDGDLLCNGLQLHDTFDSLAARYYRVWEMVAESSPTALSARNFQVESGQIDVRERVDVDRRSGAF